MARDRIWNPVNPDAFRTQRLAEGAGIYRDGFPNKPGCYTETIKARGTETLTRMTNNALTRLNLRKGFTIIQMTTTTCYPVFIRTIIYKIGE